MRTLTTLSLLTLCTALVGRITGKFGRVRERSPVRVR
jgi:hypothetical protein